MKQHLLILWSLLLFPAFGLANPLVVVPGGNAGYLYFPANGGGQSQSVQISLVRNGSFAHYRIISEPSGLLCEATECNVASARFPVGTTLVLRAEGEYAPGLSVLPEWFEGCQAGHQASCTLVVPDRPLTIRVQADFVPGAPVRLPEGGRAIYAGQMDTRYLVALPHNQGNGYWATQNNQLHANDQRDGRQNMALIPDSDEYPAARLCRNISNEAGAGWYLPAILELSTLAPHLNAISNTDGHYWSSSEKDGKKAFTFKSKDSKVEDKEKSDKQFNVLCIRSF